MRFDASRVVKGLNDMGRSAARADKMVNSEGRFFAAIMRRVGLANVTDPTVILNLPQVYGDRIKRARGVTVSQEIGRRILQLGTSARGWKRWKMTNEGGIIRVFIRDYVGYSALDKKADMIKSEGVGIASKRFYTSINRYRDNIIRRFQRG